MNETIDIESKKLWNKAKEIYLSTLTGEEERGHVERYFSMITSVTNEGGKFTIVTSNEYASDFLKKNYSDRLQKCLELISEDKSIELEFVFDKNATPAIVIPVPPREPAPKEQAASTFISTLPLNNEYTFEEFVEGPSNSWALAAAQGVVANPGKTGYNPLFIHGGTGLGKTHLMQAIGNELKKRHPQMAICYLTAETFLNEYINSLTNGTIESFRNRYRNIDLMMIDDVQFLQKGKGVQEEFFNTFNALQQAHKQIVMTSDVAPKNLPAIEQRLISRFEGGMVQEIESPNYETRLAILKKKSESLSPSIPNNALEYIADTIKSHVRAMEGALSKISMFRIMNPTTAISTDTLNNLLKDFIEKEQSYKKITVEEIQNAVAKKFGVTIAQIISSERTQSIVTPRQMAMYISRKYTTKSLPEIAVSFGKTHATILYGAKMISKRLDVEPELKNILADILNNFGYKISDSINS